MNQISNTRNTDIDDAEEIDFSKMKRLERGRYFRKFQQGYRITIHKADGSIEVREIPPSTNIIVLDPDVQAYFPDSEAVNRALRELLALVPR